PTQGRLALFDREVAGLDRNARAALRRRMGVVLEALRLVNRLSLEDNVALPLRLAGTPDKRISDNVSELLGWLGLAARRKTPVGALPAAERQLAALARAIIGNPQLLVADAP